MNLWKMAWAREMFIRQTCYIYFIQMDKIGPIKIGTTRNIKKRMFSLNTNSPYKLNLLCFFPGNEIFEKELHYAFAEIRLNGEWFLPHPKLLSVIEEQIYFNKRDDFVDPNPKKDFRDYTLGGNAWKMEGQEDEPI